MAKKYKRLNVEIHPGNFYEQMALVEKMVIEFDLRCRVVVTDKPEARREVQNALAHVWKGQFAKQQKLENDYVWGAWKLDYLLDLKLADESLHEAAMREKFALNGIAAMMAKYEAINDLPPTSDRERQIEAANVAINSSGIPLGVFADWLSCIQRAAAEAGVVLTSNKEDEKKAIGK